jgi:hypothetical protein
MSIVYWDDSAQDFFLATSMQAVAIDPDLWKVYLACGQEGRKVFQECIREDHEWSLDTVRAYAAEMDKPPVTTPPPQATPTPQPSAPTTPSPTVTAIRARGTGEDSSASKFIAWMYEHTGKVAGDPGLSYGFSNKYTLRDGTVGVSVSFNRAGRAIRGRGLSFVFHYHPGATGAKVGSVNASKWHFKPYDGAQKYVRLEDSQFASLNTAMVKRVKEIARGK